FYYVTINAFYNNLKQKPGASGWIKPIALGMLIQAIYFFVNYKINSSSDVEINVDGKVYDQYSPALLIFSYVMSVLFSTALSLLLAYLTSLRDDRKQQKILEEQKMQLEVEKSQANYNFLKAQINPHFLHNTLNFLYARSLPYSKELSEGILTLSEIMRYALNEKNQRDGLAPLKDEIEHVRNVIKINQLRFSNALNVKFEVEGVINGARIIPFVLITLVENAFKHGDLKDQQFPIEARLVVKDGSLYFYCRNKKKSGPKELSTGIGIDNIMKRLELAYGKDFSFKAREEEQNYTTELIIHKL
ncbi:MAG: hypothetical protein EOP48_32905, partial [Sphingobacteriales bacterium]